MVFGSSVVNYTSKNQNAMKRNNMNSLNKFCLLIALIVVLGVGKAMAQKVYPITSGEMIFSTGTTEFTDAYLQQYPGASVSENPLRFTMFFHFTQYWHLDFGNNFGMFMGLGVKNVGTISDEVLYNGAVSDYQNYKIIRRVYTGGVPLALKLGSFKDNLYFFGGGEVEFPVHFKEKYWNSHDRDGSKTKTNEWFGSQTQTVMPSVIAGVQFPGGVNLKFKYYLNDFLNNDYTATNFVSDLTRYKTSQVWYFSLSWQFNTAYIFKGEEARVY